MYKIEYYKTKKEKPIIKEPEYSSDNERINYMLKRRYLHQKDLNDKCYNIKSLTVDMDDINHIIQDRKLHYLFSLYARTKRKKVDESINSVTILNNNKINLLYIYEIINCKWMVNSDEELNSADISKTEDLLIELNDKYEKETELKNKVKIKDEIDLIKYYIDTVTSKYNDEIKDIKTLKLGNGFIRTKERTIN